LGVRRNQLLGLLGHELQHAAEIAAEPAVLDDRSLSALYRRIGFRSGPATGDHFDSDAAIDAGDRVTREAHAARGARARCAHHPVTRTQRPRAAPAAAVVYTAVNGCVTRDLDRPTLLNGAVVGRC
jgi:hypothetical protein